MKKIPRAFKQYVLLTIFVLINIVPISSLIIVFLLGKG